MAVYRIPTHSNFHENGSLVFKRPKPGEEKSLISRDRLLLVCLITVFTVLLVFRFTAKNPGAESTLTGTSVSQENAIGMTRGAVTIGLRPEFLTVDSRISALLTGTTENTNFQWYRNGIELSGETAMTLGPQELRKGDELTFTAISDDMEESVSSIIENSFPVISSVNFSPEVIHSGVTISASASGLDADDDYIDYSYRWVINGEEDTVNYSSLLTGEFIKRGDKVSVVVTPYDADGRGEEFVSVPIVIQNAPPEITSSPPSVYEAGSFSYRIKAVDRDGDKINFSLGTAPEGMTIDSEGFLSWSFGDMETSEHEVEVIAIDSEGRSTSQSFTLSIEGSLNEDN